MTERLVSRLIVAVALVVPITLGAAQQIDFGAKRAAAQVQHLDLMGPRPVPSNLSMTLTPTGVARLKFSSETAIINAEGQEAQVTYTIAGMVVDMSAGNVTFTSISGDFRSRDHQVAFKTLHITFAPNGDMISFKRD